MRKQSKYTNEELLNMIKSKQQELGTIPKYNDFPKSISSMIYRQFGSFISALESAGINKVYINKDEILQVVKKFYNDNNRIPSYKEIEKTLNIPYRNFFNIFGSWNRLLKEFGFEAKPIKTRVFDRTIKYSKNDLIIHLQNKYNELGRVPIYKDVVSPSYQTYRFAFGSWDNALKAAGIKKPIIVKPEKPLFKKKKPKKYNREILINKLIERYNELGYIPLATDMKPPYPSYRVYYRNFNSWNDAIKESGLTHCKSKIRKEEYEKYSDTLLISKLKLKAIELGYIPHSYQMHYPCAKAYIQRFGTWENALIKAELINKFYNE